MSKEFFSKLLKNYKNVDALLKEREVLLEELKDVIKASNFKDLFLMKETGMSKHNYYRRLNKPELWTQEELEKLKKALEEKGA